MMLLAAVAARTTTIRMGTAVTLLANLDPLRVAEDLAMLDVLSLGRAQMTFARGVMESTMAAFGIENVNDLRPRFEENLRLVIRLLTEESVTWSGQFRAPLNGVRLEPRPLQKPHPPLIIGGGLSNVSCDLAVDLGLPLTLPSLFRYPEDYLPIVERYRERMAATGQAAKAELSYPSYVHVARHRPGGPPPLAGRTWRTTSTSPPTSAARSAARSTTRGSSRDPPSAAARPRSSTGSATSTSCSASTATT